MDFNRINLEPMRPGWGCIWQGGIIDHPFGIKSIPGPLVIVNMNRGEINEPWIDHETIHAVLSAWIDDSPSAILPDNVYLGLVSACVSFLEAGVNLYIHCAAGISRATYMDVGIHMRALNLSYEDALELIRQERPFIGPNQGFTNHLKMLEPRLRP